MKRLILLFTLFYLSLLYLQAQGTQLLREPTLSENHIVFMYANDLWITPRSGGEATRLTSAQGSERSPHFSPNGEMIAFTAQYDGNTDVYIMATSGGQPTRLTWHPGADEVQGWTPDGQHVLFRSGREGVPTKTNKLFTVSITGGIPQSLPIGRAAFGELSGNGNKLAYTPITFWDPEWRNYRGGQAMPIWIIQLDDLSLERIPQATQERQLDPVWLNNKIYFRSERDYTMNIWMYDPASKTLDQMTTHTQFDVKSLDAGPNGIIYEQGGYLHLLDPETKKTTQLNITVQGDLTWSRPRWENVRASQLMNPQISPTGQRAIFEYRGDIFTVPKEHGSWRAITQSSDAADRSPVWSPDGQRIAWFSDQSGEYQLMIADQKGLEEPQAFDLPDPTFYYGPVWSPDGNYIAFTDTDYNLCYLDVETGEVTIADTDRYAHPNREMKPVWSPDSKWIAYARQQDNHFKTIMVYSLTEKKALQVTSDLADALTPAWDATGKYLYVLASTDYGLNSGWLDMSSYDPEVTRNLYLVILDKETKSPLIPRIDDEPQPEASQSADQPDSVVVQIDFEDIQNRILAIEAVPSGNFTSLVEGPENSVFIMQTIPNQLGSTMHKYNLKSRKLSTFMKPVFSAVTSLDKKRMLYRSGTGWGIVSTSGESKKVGDGQLTINIRKKVVPQDEYVQIFKEGWRFQRDYLYVDNLHGAPWEDVYTWYRPWVDHVKHRSEMTYVLDIMSGEVSIGHSYTGGGDFPDIDNIPVGLLGADFTENQGRYQITKIYTGESWNPSLKAPLAVPGLEVSEGDYILAVNGESLTTATNMYSLFEGTSNRPTELLVNTTPTEEGARVVTVVPVSSENNLRRYDWIEHNRRTVDELSGGKLAYVYVPNTSGAGFSNFNRYYFAQQDKQGVIIDERNNGGGSAADYMIDIMNRKLFGYFNSKANDRRPWTTPMAGIFGPKVMIINERAGSGGDLLPYMFRAANLGPLVGTRTWGGLVGTWDTPRFVDGGYMIAPRGGFFDTDGKWSVEGEGVPPDIEVIQEPSKVAAGGDPQLERSVTEALKLLPEKAVERKPEPQAPNRYRRAGND
ncbi:MAG: PD40 domain-containing protein [Saprospiraceae bacterium]|nr:PD40 domain-containing protein [Saprospiraceae bacterium]